MVDECIGSLFQKFQVGVYIYRLIGNIEEPKNTQGVILIKNNVVNCD